VRILDNKNKVKWYILNNPITEGELGVKADWVFTTEDNVIVKLFPYIINRELVSVIHNTYTILLAHIKEFNDIKELYVGIGNIIEPDDNDNYIVYMGVAVRQ